MSRSAVVIRKLIILAAAGFGSLLVSPRAGAAIQPQVDTPIELRLRWESWDTPSLDRLLDANYSFWNLRARFGLDVAWKRWSIHGVLHGAAAYGLPERGAFGVGPAYVAASGGDTDPGALGILELNARYEGEDFHLTVGRQPWADGLEILTGVPRLDTVKKTRLSERLLGRWDWVNVGRRHDGVTFGIDLGSADLTGVVLRPLAGGVDYDDAFRELDGLEVYGLTLTGRYDRWLPVSELRLFGLLYDDDRPGAVVAAGGDLEITTLGASLLVGGPSRDLMLWAAVQSGDWGVSEHDAWAVIVEAGHDFPAAAFSPSVRVGLAQASGGPVAGPQHRTFFNLLPTNHKYYGSIDFNAFANLRDLYAEIRLRLTSEVSLRIGLHSFALEDRRDAWYGGSGAFDEARLGFAARRPSGGGPFTSDSLGSEIDVQASRSLAAGFELVAGVSYFDGGSAARQVLVEHASGSWAFVQLSWKR